MDKELIEELYQSLILEHSKRPRNFGTLEQCTCHQKGKNPSCGDELEVFLKINENTNIEDIKFYGKGCALFMSSSSLMTQIIKGKSIEEANKILSEFIDFILEDDIILNDNYEPLHIFENIKNFPLRVKCVLLPWRTVEYSLNLNNTNMITTE